MFVMEKNLKLWIFYPQTAFRDLLCTSTLISCSIIIHLLSSVHAFLGQLNIITLLIILALQLQGSWLKPHLHIPPLLVFSSEELRTHLHNLKKCFKMN